MILSTLSNTQTQILSQMMENLLTHVLIILLLTSDLPHEKKIEKTSFLKAIFDQVLTTEFLTQQKKKLHSGIRMVKSSIDEFGGKICDL